MTETENEHYSISIPKLYKRKAIDLLMFGFVEGMKAALPSLTIQECLIQFQRRTRLSDNQYPLESARTVYNRMQKEYTQNITKCYRNT